MNKKTTFVGMVAALMMLTSCQSMNQFYGTATGASLGGLFGSAIGGIADGRRGSDLGTVVGMAVGGIVGAAATAPKTDSGNYRSSDYYYDYDRDDYRQKNAPLPTSKSRSCALSMRTTTVPWMPTSTPSWCSSYAIRAVTMSMTSPR